MTTTIYTISDYREGDTYAFPTLKAAKAYRLRAWANGDRPEIVKETLADLPRKDLMCALYNRSQYRTDHEVVVPENERRQ